MTFKPPLLLDTSFVSELELVANSEFNVEGEPETEVDTDVKLASDPDDPESWHIGLKITLQSEAEDSMPYSGHLLIHGFFRFTDLEQPRDKVARAVAVNGASMLYSSAREYLLMVTSRGPWPAVTLPTVSFLDLQPLPPTEEYDSSTDTEGEDVGATNKD